MVQTIKNRMAYLLELYNAPEVYWCYTVNLIVALHNRTGNASLDWRTTCEAEFGETSDTSCLRFKLYQPIRVHDSFARFPHQRWIRGRYLGLAEDSGGDLAFIMEVIWDRKKTHLTRSVVQE